MSSLNLLNVFRKRELHDRFRGFINTAALTKEEKQLFKDIGKWYESDTSLLEIDWNVFRGWFFSAAHPKMGETNTNIYNDMLDKLDDYDEPDEAFAKHTMHAFLMRELCGRVSEITLAGYEGEREVEFEQITAVMDEYEATVSKTQDIEEYFVTADIDDLNKHITTGGLSWRHDELNRSVGNLRVGKLVLFGARPNAGKTTWLCDNVTHMASQLDDDEVVIWFNNEEAGEEVKYRLVESALAITGKMIDSDTTRAKAEYEAKVGGWHKILIVDKASLSTKDVEYVLRKCKQKVGLMVFDQLWKVHGFESKHGNEATQMQQKFQWARELAKEHSPIIATHQADFTAEGEKSLTMSQLHMNKTGVQGECDTIIMMGRTYETGEEAMRFFTVCKNKGAYGPVVDPSLVEHRYVKDLKHEVARYE